MLPAWTALGSRSTMASPCLCSRSGSLLSWVMRLTRKSLTPCRIFASAKIKTSESIIIRSTVRVSVRYTYNNECCERVRPVSDVTGPNIPSALSSSSSLPMAVTWFCSFSDSVLRADPSQDPAAGQLCRWAALSYPPLRLSPLLPSGCEPSSSRLNQHKVCFSCRPLGLSAGT